MIEFTIDPALTRWVEHAQRMGEEAVNGAITAIDNNLEVPIDTGKMSAAFAFITPAHRDGAGWSGGIGKMEMVGDPFAKPPEHTISEFLKWYRGKE